MKLVIISGMSGAGRTQALRKLEDIGFFCVDNLPPELIPSFIRLCMEPQTSVEKAALVIDVRSGSFYESLFKAIDNLKKDKSVDCEILFLESNVEAIARRYRETRRRHPLSESEGFIEESIKKEREKLQKVKEIADHIIDTSEMTTKQLGEKLASLFDGSGNDDDFVVMITTFGFKRDMPLDTDMMLDVRFIPNPYYVPELKGLTGREQAIHDYVFSFPQSQEFMDKLVEMIEFLIPYYCQEDKKQLGVAIGCTGGMHRSVAVGEALYKALTTRGRKTLLYHRDIGMDIQGRV